MEMPILSGAACFRCGDILEVPGDNAKVQCRACRLGPPAFERAVAYGLYHHRMRAAIHALKFEKMRPAARRLGSMLAQAISTLYGEAPMELLVVPVPLHRTRHSYRGFNQARILAEHAVEALQISHPGWRLTMASDALNRIRATESQTSLTPRQRRINLRGAFQVSDAGYVRDKDVLVVDDIFTTGSTARAAALALKRAGARTVWVATLARARRTYFSNAPANAPSASTSYSQPRLHPPNEPALQGSTASTSTSGNQPTS